MQTTILKQAIKHKGLKSLRSSFSIILLLLLTSHSHLKSPGYARNYGRQFRHEKESVLQKQGSTSLIWLFVFINLGENFLKNPQDENGDQLWNLCQNEKKSTKFLPDLEFLHKKFIKI